MAHQKGIVGLRGTIGGMTFRKDGSVRHATEASKEHYANARSMARVRENAAEFSFAATAGKRLCAALGKQLRDSGDRSMRTRLFQLLRYIINLDADNPRGQRQVLKVHTPELAGFDFNTAAPLHTQLFITLDVSISPAWVVTTTIPALVPVEELAAPVKATHYMFEVGVAVLDFTNDTSRIVTASGVPAPAPIGGVADPSLSITAALGAPPDPAETVVVVLGLNYYQEVNGRLYSLENGANNPLTIIYAG